MKRPAGILLLSDDQYEEYKKRENLLADSTEASEPAKPEKPIGCVLPSDTDQLKSQLRKLGLQEVEVNGNLALVPVDSGKRFTSVRAQQESVKRIVRRVPCTRLSAYVSSAPRPESRKQSTQSAPVSPKPTDESTVLRQEARHLFSYASRKAACETRERKRQLSEASMRAELKSIKRMTDIGDSYLRTQDPRVLEEMQSLLSANYSSGVFSPKNFEKTKHLDRKIFHSLSSDPAHFYRAAVSPQQAVHST